MHGDGANLFLGTQGFSYKDWVGGFYPPDARPADYLRLYAGVFNAVELDTTFYAAPRPALVDTWRRATPPGFQFTAKVPRSITHDRHLVDAAEEMNEFLGAIAGLEEKLGAILLQMPPDFTYVERDALSAFLRQLPAELSFAVELRHRSWVRDETFNLLREHGAAWTIVDLHFMPRVVELTADFAYIRWLGDRRQIQRMNAVQIDRHAALDAWAEKLDDIAKHTQRIYGFANNHYSGHSPADIRYLRARLGLPEESGVDAPRQGPLL